MQIIIITITTGIIVMLPEKMENANLLLFESGFYPFIALLINTTHKASVMIILLTDALCFGYEYFIHGFEFEFKFDQ